MSRPSSRPSWHRANRLNRFAGCYQLFQKKLTGTYSAARAAVGARTIKTGQSRWFVGYKKHTLRLWLAHYQPAAILIPLVSWAAPANRNETNFVFPSLLRCAKRFNWVPQWTVGDMAYIDLKVQRRLREELKVAFIT